jgi:hypothetical protein
MMTVTVPDWQLPMMIAPSWQLLMTTSISSPYLPYHWFPGLPAQLILVQVCETDGYERQIKNVRTTALQLPDCPSDAVDLFVFKINWTQ